MVVFFRHFYEWRLVLSRFNRAITRFFDVTERIGSRLPDPLTLFVIAAALVAIVSWLFSVAEVSVVHPGTGATVSVVNLLSAPMLRRMFTDAVTNFTAFPPLGLVLVTMIGISVAERTGFITALLRITIHSVPKPLLTAAVVFAGVNSSIAADAGYVVLIPLGALIFAAVGRHPFAGLSATFAGVAGGFSANLSVTSLDPLLGGITETAARMLVPDYSVSSAANWYFMIASTFFITAVITFVCNRFVEPRLGKWNGTSSVSTNVGERLSSREKRAMLWASLTFGAALAIICFLATPYAGVLYDASNAARPLESFEKSIVTILMIVFLLAGLVYGFATKILRNDKDVAAMTADGMATMGGYIVLAFVMAQFISYFGWSNLGVITAVNGADFLRSLHLQGPFLLAGFVLVAAVINLLVASASAKWAIMAPVFVPMLLLMGIAPEATQLAYRLGDSTTNMIAPLLSYIPLIIVAMRRYQSEASLGTLLSLMLPYSVAMILLWTLFMLLWLSLGLPLGL